MSDFNYTHDKENFKIKVQTPYNAEFVKKARNIRGSWDKETSEWVFDDSVEDYVKDALMECYGTTGEGIVEICSILIKDKYICGDKGPAELFGRTIARAFGRDSGAKLGDDIIWISGDYNSSGSMKNWSTRVDGTFEIQNFPLPRTEFEDVQKAIQEGWCEIKMPKRKRTQEQIQEDIDKYENILKELREELNSLK